MPFVLWASGSARAAVEVRDVFKASNAFRSVSVQVRGSVPRFVLVYRGLAIATNSGIQRQQYPAALRNSGTCLLVFGGGI